MHALLGRLNARQPLVPGDPFPGENFQGVPLGPYRAGQPGEGGGHVAVTGRRDRERRRGPGRFRFGRLVVSGRLERGFATGRPVGTGTKDRRSKSASLRSGLKTGFRNAPLRDAWRGRSPYKAEQHLRALVGSQKDLD